MRDTIFLANEIDEHGPLNKDVANIYSSIIPEIR